eukprot:gene39232-biopygen104876
MHSLPGSFPESLLYMLVKGELTNGCPLWKHDVRDLWLYSGTNGVWYIGGAREKRKGFQCYAGFMECADRHQGLLPELMGAWRYSRDGGWVDDRLISIMRKRYPEEAAAGERIEAVLVAQSRFQYHV